MQRRVPTRTLGRLGLRSRPLARRPVPPRLKEPPSEESAGLSSPMPRGARLDRPLYCLRNAEGRLCAVRLSQGECLLLFTSLAAAAAYAAVSELGIVATSVFSQSQPEFLEQASRLFDRGFIGGLIDLTVGRGGAAFVGFDIDRRQVM